MINKYSIIIYFEKYQSYFAILGAFLIQLTLGGFYNSGNIQSIIVQYMQNFSLSNTSVTMENTAWIFGVLLLGMGAAISFGGFLEMKLGPLKTVLLGGWLMSFNICLMFATINTYLPIVIISYGLLGGFGMGIAYGVSLGTPLKWFGNNNGLIFGFVVSGISFSSIIFDAVQDALISDNGKINILRLPESFIILSCIYSIIQLIGSILLRYNPQNKIENAPISSCINKVELTENQSFPLINILNETGEMQPHHILFVLDFWILWMIMFLNSFCISLITSLFIRYSAVLRNESYNINQSLKAIAIIGRCFNCFGRIFWAFLMDKFSFKTLMLIITLSVTVLIALLPVIPILILSWHIPVFGLWFTIIHFFISGTFSLFPIMCSKLFGIKYFVCNYGLLFTSCSVGGTIISLVIMLVYPESANNNTVFTNMIIIGSSLSFFAALLTLLYRGKSVITHIY